jgi:uncharacterized GH25 family protein
MRPGDDSLEPPMNSFKVALAACGLLAGSTASAHEFWLEPTAFNASAGGPIGIYVCNGSGFEGWSLPRDPRRIEAFVATGPDGAHPVVGLDGSEPAGIVRLTAPGGYVIAYRSNRSMTVQADETFDEYLSEKGLDTILARRKQQGHRGGRVRESYSRYAKALVQIGASPGVVDRAMGLPLELVAEQDLLLKGANSVDDADETRTFRLLYRGKPLAGALVAAVRPGTTDTDRTARTDRDGRVSFGLGKDGAWRITAVHMVQPPKGVDADWDSLWASLTFELPRTSADISRAPSPASADARRGSSPATRCLNHVAMPALQAQR